MSTISEILPIVLSSVSALITTIADGGVALKKNNKFQKFLENKGKLKTLETFLDTVFDAYAYYLKTKHPDHGEQAIRAMREALDKLEKSVDKEKTLKNS